MRESWATHISHSKLNFTSFRISLYSEEDGEKLHRFTRYKAKKKSSACWGCGNGRREKFISLILLFCVLCCFTLTLEAIPVTFDILNPDSIESVHYLHTALVLSRWKLIVYIIILITSSSSSHEIQMSTRFSIAAAVLPILYENSKIGKNYNSKYKAKTMNSTATSWKWRRASEKSIKVKLSTVVGLWDRNQF